MTNRRPDFFIVGAPKAGTTAMYAYLRTHPQLFLPERKELRFFGRDLELRDRRPLSMPEYLAYFEAAPEGTLIGTAYVWYLFSRSAAAEIAQFNRAARIVVMVRNPLDLLPALHSEHLSNGNEDIPDFTAALDAQDDRRAGRRIPPHAHLPQGLQYTDVPRFTEQISRYQAAFGAERVHVVVFDDFAASPAEAYAATLRFLGVRDDLRPASFEVVNPNKRLRSEWLRHLLARPPELPRRLIRRAIPASIRRAAYERVKRHNVVAAPRPEVPPHTRDRLREMFRDEVRSLSGPLGRDLGHWLDPSPPRT
jgi:hypothetical protein